MSRSAHLPAQPAQPEQRSLFDEPVLPALDHALVFRHPQAQRDVWLDGHLVAYEMRRARRRSIGFVVGEQGLSVSAPRWVGAREIDSALQEKSAWILRKLGEQRERAARAQAARIAWHDGSSLPFLGDTLLLRLDARTTGALLDNNAEGLPGVPRRLLRVGLPPSATAEQIRDVVHSWLQRQARRIFEERCRIYAQRLGVTVRRLSLSSAATRWGSASADGSIRLNWRLVHFGMTIIDYVVTHELAHLREMNHSPAFWEVVRSVLPDYQQARGKLRTQAPPVHD